MGSGWGEADRELREERKRNKKKSDLCKCFLFQAVIESPCSCHQSVISSSCNTIFMYVQYTLCVNPVDSALTVTSVDYTCHSSIYRIAGNFSEIETLTIFASRHENAKV